MEWEDQAFVLQARRLEEGKMILHLLTREQGRYAGVARLGRQQGQLVEPVSECQARWSARLSEHLGTLSIEPVACHAARVFDDPLRLSALQALAQLLFEALPEREPMPPLFDGVRAWLELLDSEFWPQALVKLELGLLASLGGALDLERCAVTGQGEGLTHVSPRTGRAVSAEAAAPYLESGRLLTLPAFLGGQDKGDEGQDVVNGLILTGHFLARSVFHPVNRPLPPARAALLQKLADSQGIALADQSSGI
ncbi:MAG: DNA repair protein RecO [Alphaproteobacteria bacterium]